MGTRCPFPAWRKDGERYPCSSSHGAVSFCSLPTYLLTYLTSSLSSPRHSAHCLYLKRCRFFLSHARTSQSGKASIAVVPPAVARVRDASLIAPYLGTALAALMLCQSIIDSLACALHGRCCRCRSTASPRFRCTWSYPFPAFYHTPSLPFKGCVDAMHLMMHDGDGITRFG